MRKRSNGSGWFDHNKSMGGSSLSSISRTLNTMSRVGVDNKPCIFYKLIVPSIIHLRKLRIPEKFVTKFGHELSAVAKLTITNGRMWLVGLTRDGNKIWFQNGWQEFVQHYSVGVGYFLVFRYEGHSVFNVCIFNLTTSEIDYQTNHLNSRHQSNRGKQHHLFEEMEDDESVDSLGSFSPCRMPSYLKREVVDEGVDRLTLGISYKSMGQQIYFDQSKLKNCVAWSNEDNRNMPNGVVNPQAAIQGTGDVGLQYNGMQYKNSADSKEEIRRIKKTLKKRRNFESDEQEPSSSARKRIATAEERERALSASKMFEPINPFCRVVLRPSYLYRGCIMYFPAYFAEKHLIGVSGFIKLQNSDGKQWSVRCLNRGGKAKLSLGWYDFSLENNLGEGDVCVFELISMKDIVLKVSTFRVLQDPRQCGNY